MTAVQEHYRTRTEEHPGSRRRPRRGLTPTDVAVFRHQVEQALAAFQADVGYAVLIARAAVTITRKREAGQSRRDARELEA